MIESNNNSNDGDEIIKKIEKQIIKLNNLIEFFTIDKNTDYWIYSYDKNHINY